MRKKALSTPHDKGYKRNLSNPKEFLHFLQKYIGDDWTKDIKVSQLKLCDKEFVGPDYEGREADLLYELTEPDGQKTYLSVLDELQSSVDYTMIFRILLYIVSALQRIFLTTDEKTRKRKDFRLPAIIPIVFYNGSRKWNAVTELREYQLNSNIFGSHVLNLKYYLVDLSQISETFILNSNTLLDNIMYCDKARKRTEFAEILSTVMERALKLDMQDRQELVNWIDNTLLPKAENKEKIKEMIGEYLKKGGDRMEFQHNLARYVDEDRKKNRREGRKEGEKKGRRAERKILNTLFQYLKDDGRIDELLASINNTKLQNKLLKEYGLSTTVK